MGCQEPNNFAHAEGHPHFIVLFQGASQSHCVPESSVSCMQQHAGVLLFVVARGQTCGIRERWLVQDSVSILDD